MINVRDLAIRQGRFHLDGITLCVPRGRYAVLMGRTGSGKTTVLEAVAGLRCPVAGRILLGGRDVTGLDPADRDVGFVPQDGALFRTMTVRQNLGFALALRRRPADAIAARVHELAGWLGIDHLLDRRAVGLSGGETQRVALGRAWRTLRRCCSWTSRSARSTRRRANGSSASSRPFAPTPT